MRVPTLASALMALSVYACSGGGGDDESPVSGSGEDLPWNVASAADLEDPAVAELVRFIEERQQQDSPAGRIYKGEQPQWRSMLPKPPQVSFSPEREYYWHLKTSKGEITVRLWPKVAPMHVSSTIYLTLLGFYDDLKFHRVMQGFMAQGGCPFGTGMGDPGYRFDGEIKPDVRHDRPGLLSMANAGPGTDGSQFFLTFVPTPHLDGKHTVFGEVVGDEGMATLRAIEKVGAPPGAMRDAPSVPIIIQRAWISVR